MTKWQGKKKSALGLKTFEPFADFSPKWIYENL